MLGAASLAGLCAVKGALFPQMKAELFKCFRWGINLISDADLTRTLDAEYSVW